MGSCGGETTSKKKAIWLYPKFLGHNPPKRWGHSSCFSHSQGLLYIFGGCCGGLHFSDVIMLNLRTMSWTAFPTTGRGPGPRDSHSAVIVRNKMVVFGGSNGSHKVNDLHVLDLASGDWSQPNCVGNAPSPRESHTATVLGEDKIVIFGGSGEGEANYLNDLHVLDLGTMKWSSPSNIRGDLPVPRDSHSAVAVANKLIVYGGDGGDRYHGDVAIFDLDTSTWSTLDVEGACPGARAGHASVAIGSKVYVMGGVGDRHYYNDVWVLDTMSSYSSWTQLDICDHQPQGRFSHTAVVTSDLDIAIYGGCGEDERPLNELLLLRLGTENYPTDLFNFPMCKAFRNGHWRKGKRRYIHDEGEDIRELQFQSLGFNSDMLHPKRRRMTSSKVWNVDLEQDEEHSLSSQSDHDHIAVQKPQGTSTGVSSSKFFKQLPQQSPPFIHHLKEEQCCEATATATAAACLGNQKVQHRPMLLSRPSDCTTFQDLIGAEVNGKVDGAFDSGLLMTAAVNGKVFRGVLFPPQPAITRPLPPTSPVMVAQPMVGPTDQLPAPMMRRLPAGEEPLARLRNDLQGVVLTLAGPGESQT